MSNWFDELSENRRMWVESTRRNKFERGIRQSTVDKYADPAHFIYELLQNAEDQEATEVCFKLAADHLLFEHNGNPFTQKDVENITGLGNSNKPEQANKIGRFGIGFKSVFVITDTPEIYTTLEGKPFGFIIQDLVVPIKTKFPKELIKDNRTRFILPFKKEKIYELRDLVSMRLYDIGSDSLIFLKNISYIKWEYSNDEGVYFCDRGQENGKYRLVDEIGVKGERKARAETIYLVFSKAINIPNADRELTAKIAFRMENNTIVPEPGYTTLNVYFPTEEKTGLKFRLHAPFLLTDNRANIKRGEKINEYLMSACASLLVESLPVLRDRGLLTVTCLNYLPIKYEPIQQMPRYHEDDKRRRERYKSAEVPGYEPFFEAVRDVLRAERLLPTGDGRFVKAYEVKMARSAALRTLLGVAELSELYGFSQPMYWLSEEITEDKTPELRRYLREVIGINEIDQDAFATKISASFLVNRTDDWLIRFYEFLMSQEALWGRGKRHTVLRCDPNKPIIRLENGKHVAPFKEDGETPNAYLPPEGETHLPIVKHTIAQAEIACTFLSKLGLKEPDILAYILEVILPRYQATRSEVVWEQYAKDIHQIAEAVTSCSVDRRKTLLDSLSQIHFIAACNAANPSLIRWKKPDEVYQPTDELKKWFEGNKHAWFVRPELISMPDWQSICSHIRIETRMRTCKRQPDWSGHIRLKRSSGHHQRGLHSFDPEATIEGLEQALQTIKFEKAHLLWNVLLRDTNLVQGIVETATHVAFDNVHDRQTRRSPIGELCTTLAWLPDRQGRFFLPSELFLTDLHESFEKESAEAKTLADKLQMRQPAIQEAAKTLGVREDVLADIIKVYQQDPQAVHHFLESKKKPVFPEKTSPNPERRAAKVEHNIAAAPDKVYEQRQRSVRVSNGDIRIDRKAYLRHFYTNDIGQMVCQICEYEMPFRLERGLGDYYFEAVECISVLRRECHENYLALCPTCAAMFKHANDTDYDELTRLIRDAESLEIPIALAGKDRTIRFVQEHLDDLKAVLRVFAYIAESVESQE